MNFAAILSAAPGTKCDAVHPGYGFLAENTSFAEACAKNSLRFIGPPAQAIRLMGDKLRARETVAKLGVPVIPGSNGCLASVEQAAIAADAIGYPILLKATARGGQGTRAVYSRDELAENFGTASAEARAAFGDKRIYAERFLENVRHIEVQIVVDRHGNCFQLGERGCSIQRRYQKLLEESLSPVLSPSGRAEMADAALSIGLHIGYESVGTVEFVLDRDTGRFYFLEMNTRIQVEHPVTEMITGKDLVVEQLRTAAGDPIAFSQGEVRIAGHAIECRINAENPDADFRPSPGIITEWVPPSGEGIRVDSHCYSACVVSPFYDLLLAKVITGASEREQARQIMRGALKEFVVSEIKTTIPFHLRLLDDPRFVQSQVNTRWIEQVFLAEWRDTLNRVQ